jgi:hypothetical protein
VFGTSWLKIHPKFIWPQFSHIYYEIRVSQTKQMKNRPHWVHSVRPEEPNKTKPPLQVLAVAKGNSEKNKVWDEARCGID